MTLRRIGMVIVIAIAIVVVLLTQHGLIRTGMSWIEKKPRIVILRPEGYKIQTIRPGVIYKIEALHGYVLTWINSRMLKSGFKLWLNVTKSSGRAVFSAQIGALYVNLFGVGDYYMIFKPYNSTVSRLTIVINGTYNCTIIVRKSSIEKVYCNLPYKLYSRNTLYIATVSNYTPTICTRSGNMTVCTDNMNGLLAYIEVTKTPEYATFNPGLSGIATFEIEQLSR
ncbi:MAG: hypothetical protein GXO10_04815 [Crenarchaeota archaeon]|nr:hypothetical protein [Thermoproteota archaeon]